MTAADPVYDAVVCVGRRDLLIAAMAIRSLGVFTRARRIVVLTARAHVAALEGGLDARVPVVFVDEDEAVEGVTLRAVRMHLRRRVGTSKRAGWYLQQFLKLGACRLPGMSAHCLLWDGDTIALRPLEFFDAAGRVLINPSIERHPPYFHAIERLLGLQARADHSFVSEHVMVDTGLMDELLGALSARAAEGGQAARQTERFAGAPWVAAILDAIDDEHLAHSGFSEYETYGTFLAHRRPDGFRPRRLKTLRRGKSRVGAKPDRADLLRLMLLGYASVSFERWDRKSKPRIRANRAAARLLHVACALGRSLPGCGARLAAAAHVAGTGRPAPASLTPPDA